MTTQIPLVVINGNIQQLAATDTIATGISNPFVFLYNNTATISFGSGGGTNEATLVITGLTNILSTSVCAIRINPAVVVDSGITHTANDHLYAGTIIGLTASNIVVGTGFTINARCLDKLTGGFSVLYTVI